jgi:hypothetical protein
MRRTLLAGFLGAIAMFMWMFIAHSVTPLGMTGIKEVPNEQGVLAAMTSTMGSTPGLYMYPALGVSPSAPMAERNAAMKEYEKKLATNPSGILLYKPSGAKGMESRQLVIEFLKELVMSLILVSLLAQTRITSFVGKVGFITAAGVVAAISTNISYWNWFGFPTDYTIAYLSIDLVGCICVGVVAALVMKSATGPMSRSAAA